MTEKLYTLPEKLKEIAEKNPNQIVIQSKQENSYKNYTYQEFYNTSLKIAANLQQLEIKPRDKIAIILENRPEWGFIYFGALTAGAINIPIDPQSSHKDLQFLLEDSESKIIFTSKKLLPNLISIVQQSQKIIVLDWDKKSGNNLINFSELLNFAANKKDINFPHISPDQLASIVYTSGTTGLPKGVMLTHSNFYANFLSIKKLPFSFYQSNMLSILPLHHTFPFMTTLIVPLFLQGKITYIENINSNELLECMREAGITMLIGVPQLFNIFYQQIVNAINNKPFYIKLPFLTLLEIFWLLRKFTSLNLGKLLLTQIHKPFGKTLKYFASGGAKLDPQIAKFFIQIGFNIIEGYGLTETSPVVTYNLEKIKHLNSAGKVLPDVNLKILEPDQKGVGEILIKGPNVMLGYYKHETATQEILKDGWFYSGDLGYIDKNGYLYITGRKKEIIVLSSGKNISPEEVELHYSKSPLIKEICVLEVSNKEEEKLIAIIVPDFEYCHKIGTVDIYGSIRWDLENLSKQLPPYKHIMGFNITKENLPRTRLGKIQRFAVKEQFLHELSAGIKIEKRKETSVISESDLALLASPKTQQIISVIQQKLNTNKAISLDDHLEIDLGMESLDRVELVVAIEKKLGLKIPADTLAKTFIIRDLINIIETLSTSQQISSPASPVEQKSTWKNILTMPLSQNLLQKIPLHQNKLEHLGTRALNTFLYIVFKLFWRIKVIGIENIPKDKPVILCANHISFLDGFAIAAILPTWLLNKIFFAGLANYFNAPILTRLMRIIPIDPNAQLINAMQASGYVLGNGYVLCMFPEGERSIDGKVKEFKKGVGILAQELNIDLVPIYISGTYDVWPRNKKFPKLFHKITITFGKPENIEELKKLGAEFDAKDDYEAIAKGIREKVIRACLKSLLCRV